MASQNVHFPTLAMNPQLANLLAKNVAQQAVQASKTTIPLMQQQQMNQSYADVYAPDQGYFSQIPTWGWVAGGVLAAGIGWMFLRG